MEISSRSTTVGGADKFKYQGKERDGETGYDYFEARLYDSAIGRFMQVDAFAEKYPTMNAYTGMGNNPIFFVDPTGDTIRVNGTEEEQQLINDQLALMQETKEGQALYEEMQNATQDFNMSVGEVDGDTKLGQITGVTKDADGNVTSVSMKIDIENIGKSNVPETAVEIISHELAHGKDIVKNPNSTDSNGRSTSSAAHNASESYASGISNTVGEQSKKTDTRTTLYKSSVHMASKRRTQKYLSKQSKKKK